MTNATCTTAASTCAAAPRDLCAAIRRPIVSPSPCVWERDSASCDDDRREVEAAPVYAWHHAGIVWGLGAAPEAAREDAARWVDEDETELEGDADIITAAQAARVEAGDVSWPIR